MAARRDKPSLVAPVSQHFPVLGDRFADPQFFEAIARPHRVGEVGEQLIVSGAIFSGEQQWLANQRFLAR